MIVKQLNWDYFGRNLKFNQKKNWIAQQIYVWSSECIKTNEFRQRSQNLNAEFFFLLKIFVVFKKKK